MEDDLIYRVRKGLWPVDRCEVADALDEQAKRIEYLENVLGSFGDRLMSREEQVKHLLKKCERLETSMKHLAKFARDAYRFIDE